MTWAQQAGGSSNDYGYGISALADGSSLITGSFSGTASFGSTTLPFLSPYTRGDVFIAKLNADGSYAWAQQTGSDYGTRYRPTGKSISALADGSSLITGYFNDTASFGSTTLTSAVGDFGLFYARDVFIAKLNADGSYAWAQKAGGSNYDDGYSISALADGSSLITGHFKGTASFGSTTLTSAGSWDVFIAKLNADGSYAWAQQAGGSGSDNGYSISALADGSSLITGDFEGTASFGSTTLTSAGSDDVFIAKLNADGSYAWAQQAGGSSGDYGYSISALADGSSLITGYFEGTASFGSTTLTSAGSDDVFIAKLNADGSYAWAQQAGGSGSDYGDSISALADGSSLITGDFEGTASFGSTTLTSAGGSDVFIAKLNADGSYAWAQSAGGSGSDYGHSISALADGSSLITGHFEGTASFGSTALTSAGSFDVFIAKLNADGSWANTIVAAADDSWDNTIAVAYEQGGVYRLYNSSSGKHLFSSNQTEIDQITGQGWVNEGMSYKTPSNASASLHRFFVLGENRHFYTANDSEKDLILANPSMQNFSYEGIAFNVYSAAEAPSGSLSVVRYFNNNTGSHLYSTNSTEQGILNSSADWTNVMEDSCAFYKVKLLI